jgi:hypothetical protein
MDPRPYDPPPNRQKGSPDPADFPNRRDFPSTEKMAYWENLLRFGFLSGFDPF